LYPAAEFECALELLGKSLCNDGTIEQRTENMLILARRRAEVFLKACGQLSVEDPSGNFDHDM
jgi:hypothetical protein